MRSVTSRCDQVSSIWATLDTETSPQLDKSRVWVVETSFPSGATVKPTSLKRQSAEYLIIRHLVIRYLAKSAVVTSFNTHVEEMGTFSISEEKRQVILVASVHIIGTEVFQILPERLLKFSIVQHTIKYLREPVRKYECARTPRDVACSTMLDI
ncbi:hypothetical protein RF11_12493 [Thelohanellus kitauei]|uniref:Uncharacterized protein n=1 Tax=Thelohanellus kitauei TaxID=669202 RepID=A0A0C2NGQ6_THEKT|nr:hypothetical protein RF11_12493 [Thelohanellus kitauei]